MSPIQLFLLPGNIASDALHIEDADSRTMMRTLVNMLVWNLVAVLAVLPQFMGQYCGVLRPVSADRTINASLEFTTVSPLTSPNLLAPGPGPLKVAIAAAQSREVGMLPLAAV